MIRPEKFGKPDYDILYSWINSEASMIQFSGLIFNYPITKELSRNPTVLSEKKHLFKDSNLSLNILKTRLFFVIIVAGSSKKRGVTENP